MGSDVEAMKGVERVKLRGTILLLAASLLIFAAAATGVGMTASGATPFATPVPAPTAIPNPKSTPAPTLAARTRARMTPEEKIGQRFIVRPEALGSVRGGSSASRTRLTDGMRDGIASVPVGSVAIFAGNLESPAQIASASRISRRRRPYRCSSPWTRRAAHSAAPVFTKWKHSVRALESSTFSTLNSSGVLIIMSARSQTTKSPVAWLPPTSVTS